MPSKRMIEVCMNKAEAYEREGKTGEANHWLEMAIKVEKQIEEEGETGIKVVK